MIPRDDPLDAVGRRHHADPVVDGPAWTPADRRDHLRAAGPVLVFIVIMLITAVAAGVNEMTDIALWGRRHDHAVPPVRAAAGAQRARRSARCRRATSPRPHDGRGLHRRRDGVDSGDHRVLISTGVTVVLMMQASVSLGLIVLIGLPLVIALTIALVRPLRG